LGGALADLVHLDVVTVAVPAIGVIAEQHVGALLALRGGEPPRSLLGVGTHEPPPIRRVGVEDGTMPAVGVAQVLDPVHPRTAALARSSPSRTDPASDTAVMWPSVATTITTRWPAATAPARVPPVSSTSSSGWAWNATTVAIAA
jgi:hypothetical protein